MNKKLRGRVIQASLMGALLSVVGCTKGGTQFSTESGGTAEPGGTSGGASDNTPGLSLEERKFWQDQKDYIDRSLKAGQETCGVTFSFDWVDRATLRAEAAKTGHSAYGICSAIIDEVVGLCNQGADEKASVAAKIKGFRCGYGKPRTYALDAGIVTYMGNNVESSFSETAKPWLMKNL